MGGIIGPNIKNDIVTKVSIFCVGKCFKSVCASTIKVIKDKKELQCPLGRFSFTSCDKNEECSIDHPEEHKYCKKISTIQCLKGGILGPGFIDCGRKPGCSKKHPDAFKIYLEKSE